MRRRARGKAIVKTETWAAILAATPRLWRQQLLDCVDFSAPPAFPDFVSRAKTGLPVRASCPIAELLLEADLLSIVLLDPEILPIEEAIAAAQPALRLDRQLDTRLLRRMNRPGRLWPEEIPEAEMARLLDLLINLPAIHPTSAMMLYRFLKIDRPKIRSRAVRVISLVMDRDDWTEGALADPDPRVRANLVEALSRTGRPLSNRSLGLLHRASRDGHHRVKVTALLALTQAGDCGAKTELSHLADQDSGSLGRAARWALRLCAGRD